MLIQYDSKKCVCRINFFVLQNVLLLWIFLSQAMAGTFFIYNVTTYLILVKNKLI